MKPWPALVVVAFVLVQCAAAPSDAERAAAALAADDTGYPAKAKVFLDDIEFDPSDGVVHLPLRLDRRSSNTVIVHLRTRNGSGWSRLIAGRDYTELNTRVIFRPGDPLVRTIPIRVQTTSEGWFEAVLPTTPAGADKGDGTARLSARAGAPPTRARTQGFRKPRRFQPTSAPSYTLDVTTIRWSDGGSPNSWSTGLSHGRTQPGNRETGLYLDPLLHPQAEAPFRRTADGLVLHSQRLPVPIDHEGATYRYGAAALTGRRLTATHLTTGQVEWVATVGDRRDSWPAMWLVGVKGWPPEIDVYEGFGHSADWRFDRKISHNIHGGKRGQRSFTRLAVIDAVAIYGLAPIAGRPVRFAVDIQPDFITWFVDGVETYQVANPFDEAFYPIMNVAVKADSAYDEGSGDLIIHGFRVWRER